MKKSILLLTTIFALTSAALFAEVFNSRLSSGEKSKLENGEVLIRNINSIKEVCVNESPSSETILSTMKKLNPAYVAEVIQVRPCEGNENLPEQINNILCNIADYVGIPYFSERTQKWYELYSSAEIKEIREEGNNKEIDCVLEMSLFGKFDSRINVIQEEDFFYYELKNMENLIYHEKFTAIKSKKMVSCITLFRDGDNWILYAIGGIDAPKLWFLKDRIETSFMNRIKTFCNFIFSKI
ncbi:DUF6675 family protein [Treponema berlinense]|uniref:DUF6675 family protein n=1 Tax=Treponema berlinense TaxID=225004 RepID=UPI0026EE2203|nr:DUF6675 family protein [Treponema berlinense]